MKMKKACEITFLTERAVRLYLSRQLLSPRQVNGVIDFSDEDIQRLRDIALLRQMDFSIEQIAAMLHEPETIGKILCHRLNSARAETEQSARVQDMLSGLQGQALGSVGELASCLREQRPVLQNPDFGRFDEISDEVRREETSAAVRGLSRQQGRRRLGKRMLVLGVAAVVLLMASLAFLGHTRFEGQMSIVPFTVLEVHGDGTATISTGNDWAAEVLGREAVTVPCRVYGPELTAGKTVERGAWLVVSITNRDLIRAGVNPFQQFQTASAQVNTEWVKWILHALFEEGRSSCATLLVGVNADVKPLFWWVREDE